MKLGKTPLFVIASRRHRFFIVGLWRIWITTAGGFHVLWVLSRKNADRVGAHNRDVLAGLPPHDLSDIHDPRTLIG